MAGMTALGINGTVIANNSSASTPKGTDFGNMTWDKSFTNTFSITNSGIVDLTVSGVTTTGTGMAAFDLVGMPAQIDAGTVSNFSVVFNPTSAVLYVASLSMDNNSTNTPYVINLAGTGTKRDQVIAFTNPGTQETTNAVGLIVSTGSGLTVTCRVVSGSAAISGYTNVTFSGEGPVVIAADQGGDSNWNAAPTITKSFSVTKAVADVTLTNLMQVYNGTARWVGPVTSPTGLTVNITYNGLTAGPTNAGTYLVVGAVNDMMYQGAQTNLMTINRAIDTITFSHTNQTYDGAAKYVTSNSVNGQPVGMTYNGSTTAPTTGGVYSVTGVVNTANWAGTNTTELTIAKAAQTITFPSISDQLTTSTVGLTATASSGLTVGFAVGSGSATINGGTNLTFTGEGSVSMVASQSGNGNYLPAPSQTNTFNVSKTQASVTLTNLVQVYDGTDRTVYGVTSPTGLTVNMTYNGSVTVPTNVGSYTVAGTISDVMYHGAQTNTLTVNKADQAITFPTVSNQFWTNTLGLSATATSGLNVGFTVLNGPAVLSAGTNLTFNGYGSVSVIASQAGDENWNAAPSMTNTFNVLGPNAALYGTNGAEIVNGDVPVEAKGTIFSNLVWGYPASTNIFTITNAGTATLTIESITTNWSSIFRVVSVPSNIAANSSAPLEVAMDTSAIGIHTAQVVIVYNGTNSPFMLNLKGQVEPDIMSIWLPTQFVNGAECNVFSRDTWTVLQALSDLRDIVLQTNLTDVISHFGGYAGYNPAYTNGDTTLLKAHLDYLLDTFPMTNACFASTNNAGYKSFIDQNGDSFKTDKPWLFDELPYTNTYTVYLDAGRHTAAAGILRTLENVELVTLQNRIQIMAADNTLTQVITFVSIPDTTYPETVHLSATAESGLPVCFTNTAGSPVTWLNSTTVTFTATGTVQIVASQTGSVNYLSAPLVTNSFNVSKGDQTISFGTISNQSSTNVVGLYASATSSGTVSFAVQSGPGVITDDTNLSFYASGTVLVTADQYGNNYWNPAPQITNVVNVNKSPQSALIFNPVTPQVYLTTNILTASGGSGTGAVTYAVTDGPGQIVNGNGLYINSGSGVVTVVATKAWDDKYAATAATSKVYASHADQTITFPVISDQAITTETELEATASSGLKTSYQVVTGSAAVNYETNRAYLTYSATGLVRVVASQAGNTNWNVAPAETNVFYVSPVLPVVDAVQKTAVDTATISTFSTISDNGGAPVKQRGVCWALTSLPTTGDFLTRDGTGVGAYTSVARGLEAGTTYYVRSYAINEVGTQYGAEISVTTSNEPPPPPTYGYVWNGNVGNAWTNGVNWSDGVVPGPTNTVYFCVEGTTNIAVDLAGTQSVGSVILNTNATDGVGFANGTLAMTNVASGLFVSAGMVDFESAPIVGNEFVIGNAADTKVNMSAGLQAKGSLLKTGKGALNIMPSGPVTLGGDMIISNGPMAMWGDMHLVSNGCLVISRNASLQPTIIPMVNVHTSSFAGELVISNDVPGSRAACINGTYKPVIFSDLCSTLALGGNSLELGTGSVLDITVALGELNVTGKYTIATYSNLTGRFSQVNGLTAHTLKYDSNSIVLEPSFVWDGAESTNWNVPQNWTNNSGTAVPGPENDAGFVAGGGTNIHVNVDTNPAVRSVRGLGEGSVTLEGAGGIILTNNDVRSGETPAVGAQDGIVFVIRCGLSTVPGARINAMTNQYSDAVIRIEGSIGSEPGEGDFFVDGGGRVELRGTNTFGSSTNRLVINGARLFVNGDENLGNPDAGLVFTNGGTLNVSNRFTTGRTLNFAGDGGIGTGSSNNLVTLTNVITGEGRMTVTDEGTVVLTASNLLGGASVNGGTLRVEGLLQSSGTVGIESNAVLGGNGTIEIGGSAYVVYIRFGAVCAPGASIGRITVDGSMTVDGSLDIEVENSSNDVVNIRDTLVLGNSSSLNVTGIPNNNSDYLFATFASRSGKFRSFAMPDKYTLVYGTTNIILKAPSAVVLENTNVVRNGGTIEVALNIDSNTAWNAVSTSSWITVVSGTSGTGNGTIKLQITANEDRERIGTVWIAGMKYTITQQAGTAVYLDFDGDAKADVTVYWPECGAWYILQSATSTERIQPWGWANSQPVPGDYDGDGKYDVAVYNDSYGMWYILQSETGTGRLQPWGAQGYQPVPADYDGDDITDVAVFDALNGIWHILQSSDGQNCTQAWGWSETVPVPGDYDGDGNADCAVYWADGGQWYILQSSTGTGRTQPWGWNAAEACQGDYDGDGKTDVSVYWPETGWWNILQSSDGQQRTQNWGWNAAWPVAADYDGDEKFDITVYSPPEGYWYIWQSQSQSQRNQAWGWNEAEPVN